MTLSKIVKELSNAPRKLFLLDACGAMLTAFLVGIVLVQFEATFGMPIQILHVLALIACFFAVYSFTCFYFLKKDWSRYIRLIALANLFYCIITLLLLFVYSNQLTLIGYGYFLVEILIILLIVFFEFKVAAAHE